MTQMHTDGLLNKTTFPLTSLYLKYTQLTINSTHPFTPILSTLFLYFTVLSHNSKSSFQVCLENFSLPSLRWPVRPGSSQFGPIHDTSCLHAAWEQWRWMGTFPCHRCMHHHHILVLPLSGKCIPAGGLSGRLGVGLWLSLSSMGEGTWLS